MSDYDVVIIGGGPAGLSAGLYAGRANLKTAVIERGMPGGQASTTEMIENYPGFPGGIMGPELMMKMAEQTKNVGVEFITSNVEEIKADNSLYEIKTTSDTISTKAIIFATGAEPRELGVNGERKNRGRGVSYCATCDGAFFRDRKVAVIGGGDAAVEEAMYLTKIVEKVYLIHRRDTLRATKVVQDRAFKNPKIDFIWDSGVNEILGENKVEAVLIENLKTSEKRSIAVDGVFIYVGNDPITDFFRDLINTDEKGYVITDEKMHTSARGIFAAGDLRQKSLRQVVTAVADGAIAATEAEKYISELDSILSEKN